MTTTAHNPTAAQGVSAIAFGLDDGKTHEPLLDAEWRRILARGWSVERIERLWGPIPPHLRQALESQRPAPAS